jgi:AcrR family transcriptional regulator
MKKVEKNAPKNAAEKAPKNEGRRPRDETFWKVLNAALELDFKKGHMKWTLSELSRKSSITRSLIYYHFGRSKQAILDEAINVIGEEIVGLSPERMAMWKSGDWMTSLVRARRIADQAPYLGNFYLLHRERPTDAGKALKAVEARYFKKVQTIFPDLPPAAHRALFGLFFGVTFSPLVDDEAIQFTVQALKGVVGMDESKITLKTGLIV